jgi:hypothetical protein
MVETEDVVKKRKIVQNITVTLNVDVMSKGRVTQHFRCRTETLGHDWFQVR